MLREKEPIFSAACKGKTASFVRVLDNHCGDSALSLLLRNSARCVAGFTVRRKRPARRRIVQPSLNRLLKNSSSPRNMLDSGLRRNDGFGYFLDFFSNLLKGTSD